MYFYIFQVQNLTKYICRYDSMLFIHAKDAQNANLCNQFDSKLFVDTYEKKRVYMPT